MKATFIVLKHQGSSVLCRNVDGNEVRLPENAQVELIDGDQTHGTYN